jgi:hypothetical protein
VEDEVDAQRAEVTEGAEKPPVLEEELAWGFAWFWAGVAEGGGYVLGLC